MTVSLVEVQSFDFCKAIDVALIDGWAGTAGSVRLGLAGFGLAMRNPDLQFTRFPTATNDTAIVGLRYKARDTGATRTIIALHATAGGTLQVRLRRDTTGALRVDTGGGGGGPWTSATTLTEGVVYLIELGVRVSNGSGQIQVRLDGVVVDDIDLTGLNTAGAAPTATFDEVDFSGGVADMDDVWIKVGTGGVVPADFESDAAGNPLIRTFYPTGAGVYGQWTNSGGSGANYTYIAEQLADGTGTELDTATQGLKESWKHAELPSRASGIRAVSTISMATALGASGQLQHFFRIGGIDYDHPDVPATLPASYAFQVRLWENHPISGVPWTVHQWNGDAEQGVWRYNATSAIETFVSQVVGQVMYRESAASGGPAKRIPPAFIAKKNALASPSPFMWLVQIKVPTDPVTMLRLTPNPEPIQFGIDAAGDPLEWTPFPLGIGAIEEDSAGGIPQVTLSVGSVTREVMALLTAHDYLLDQEVKLLLVHTDHLNDPTARHVLPFKVTDCSADEEVVTLTLSTQDLYEFPIPGERALRDGCRSAYKGRLCGFTDDVANTLGECRKTFAECTRRGQFQIDNALTQTHPMRFRGYPGIAYS